MSQDGSVTFDGTLLGRDDNMLTAPASGSACVHWRLRIVEPIDARLQLVHEVTSPEGFDLAWSLPALREGPLPSSALADVRQLRLRAAESRDADTIRVRVMPESLRLAATPVLHRPGSPGALRVAQQLGLSSGIAVEEIALCEGDRVSAEGFLEGGALGRRRGPFRDVDTEVRLHEAALVLPQRREIGPALLPWALGTAAAILGGLGAATWAAWHFGLTSQARPVPAAAHRLLSPEIGPPRYGRKHFSRPD